MTMMSIRCHALVICRNVEARLKDLNSYLRQMGLLPVNAERLQEDLQPLDGIARVTGKSYSIGGCRAVLVPEDAFENLMTCYGGFARVSVVLGHSAFNAYTFDIDCDHTGNGVSN